MTAVIERFEQEKAILVTADKQTICVDKTSLPKESKEGEVLRVIFSNSRSPQQDQENLAKSILNEILKR